MEKNTLYVVATPIGNLADLSPRAEAVLRQVDWIAAEDTRVTGQLLRQFGIDSRLLSLREHNEREMAERIASLLADGATVAQVSDAGTPAVSDPGARLVQTILAAGLRVCPIPGPSALATAVSAAGLSCNQHLFYGFLPPKSGARQKALAELAALPYALIFYEAPHRLAETLVDMTTVLGGERVGVLARELTKTFETIRRLPLAELAVWVEADPNQQRGESVLLIEPAAAQPPDDAGAHDAVLLPLLRQLPLKQAVQLAAEISGGNRNALYQRALAWKAENSDE